MQQLKLVLLRLKKPSVFLSLVSQIATLLIMLGVHINENYIMSIAVIVCSVLVTLGIMSNPDTQKKGYGDDLLKCSQSGNLEPHVMINGQMVCQDCGAIYQADTSATSA